MSSTNNTENKSVLESVDTVKGAAVESKQKRAVDPDSLSKMSKQGVEFVNRLGSATSAYAARLHIRPRTGWHQYWATPGEDYERCINSGTYTQVREPGKPGEKPGYESGEVKKILNAEGKIELIALECPLDAYEEYLNWMSQESSRKYMAVKGNFAQAVDDLNRAAGGHGREMTAGEIDKNGDFKPL